jgi:hypothetical protein
MDKQHTEHINDEFLKGLVKLSDEDKPSVDFTQNVMAKIPQSVVEEQEEKSMLKPWQWIAIAATLVGVIYFIITFDLNSVFRQVAGVSGPGGINYVNMFASFIQMFSSAFSEFQFTTITLTIILSGVALYLGDKFLRKWSSANMVVV